MIIPSLFAVSFEFVGLTLQRQVPEGDRSYSRTGEGAVADRAAAALPEASDRMFWFGRPAAPAPQSARQPVGDQPDHHVDQDAPGRGSRAVASQAGRLQRVSVSL